MRVTLLFVVLLLLSCAECKKKRRTKEKREGPADPYSTSRSYSVPVGNFGAQAPPDPEDVVRPESTEAMIESLADIVNTPDFQSLDEDMDDLPSEGVINKLQEAIRKLSELRDRPDFVAALDESGLAPEKRALVHHAMNIA